MRIDVHIYIEGQDRQYDQILQGIKAVQNQLGDLVRLEKTEITTLTELEDKVTALEQKVAAENTVIDSAKALIVQENQLLKDALAAGGTNAAVVARVQALADSIDAKSTDLAAAVVANTPAAPAPPEPAPSA
jgi:phosphoglycerate dehydrogenase-like enzyme